MKKLFLVLTFTAVPLHMQAAHIRLDISRSNSANTGALAVIAGLTLYAALKAFIPKKVYVFDKDGHQTVENYTTYQKDLATKSEVTLKTDLTDYIKTNETDNSDAYKVTESYQICRERQNENTTNHTQKNYRHKALMATNPETLEKPLSSSSWLTFARCVGNHAGNVHGLDKDEQESLDEHTTQLRYLQSRLYSKRNSDKVDVIEDLQADIRSEESALLRLNLWLGIKYTFKNFNKYTEQEMMYREMRKRSSWTDYFKSLARSIFLPTSHCWLFTPAFLKQTYNKAAVKAAHTPVAVPVAAPSTPQSGGAMGQAYPEGVVVYSAPATPITQAPAYPSMQSSTVTTPTSASTSAGQEVVKKDAYKGKDTDSKENPEDDDQLPPASAPDDHAQYL